MGSVVAYTDGSAHAGEGGIGVVLIGRRSVLRVAQYLPPDPRGEKPITNQVAELLAAVRALHQIALPGQTVKLISDSAYLINCFNDEWMINWRRKDWKGAGGKSVAHRPIWETLDALAAVHEVEWVHMRGHGRGDESPRMRHWNGVADALASEARRSKRSWVHRRRRKS